MKTTTRIDYFPFLRRSILVLAVFGVCCSTTAFAQSPSQFWKTSGSWNQSNNWTGGTPNGSIWPLFRPYSQYTTYDTREFDVTITGPVPQSTIPWIMVEGVRVSLDLGGNSLTATQGWSGGGIVLANFNGSITSPTLELRNGTVTSNQGIRFLHNGYSGGGVSGGLQTLNVGDGARLILQAGSGIIAQGSVTNRVIVSSGGLLESTGNNLTVSASGSTYLRLDDGVFKVNGSLSSGSAIWEQGSGVVITNQNVSRFAPNKAASNLASFSVSSGQYAYVHSAGVATLNNAATLNGGQITAPNALALAGSLNGYGVVDGEFFGQSHSTITASGGTLAIGKSNSYLGFRTQGTLNVGDDQVVLQSQAFSLLGGLTQIAGGTLSAANGFSLGSGSSLVGHGNVQGRVVGGFGSTIVANGGDLTLGDATNVAGFYSDGDLYTNSNIVTIHDANEAVLGSLTRLGNGVDGGSLAAGTANPGDTYHHFLLEAGKNLVGRGEVEGHFKNHGHVIGDGLTLSQRIVFGVNWTVSGKGTFEATLVLGNFEPGDSPAIVNGKNQAFGGTVQIELGGLTPGFGPNNHDQINDSATILLLAGAKLAVDPWNGFLPALGDQFTIMTWADGLDGEFSQILVNTHFTNNGIDFIATYINPNGPGSLMLTVVPEPSSLLLLGLGVVAGIARRSRRR